MTGAFLLGISAIDPGKSCARELLHFFIPGQTELSPDGTEHSLLNHVLLSC